MSKATYEWEVIEGAGNMGSKSNYPEFTPFDVEKNIHFLGIFLVNWISHRYIFGLTNSSRATCTATTHCTLILKGETQTQGVPLIFCLYDLA